MPPYTCRQSDYLAAIYDDRRTNYWGHACARDLNGFNPRGCCPRVGYPSDAAQPPIGYAQPLSFDAYMAGVHDAGAASPYGQPCETPCGPVADVLAASRSAIDSRVSNVNTLTLARDNDNDDPNAPTAMFDVLKKSAENNNNGEEAVFDVLQPTADAPKRVNGEPVVAVLERERANAARPVCCSGGPDPAGRACQHVSDVGAFPWSTTQRRHVRMGDGERVGCVHCSVVPHNGSPGFCEGCAPQPPYRRRMVHSGRTFVPASSLPVLDRYQWAQSEQLYEFDSPAEYREAYEGVYNHNAPLRVKFNFQSPGEQTRLWSGVPPPMPKPCASTPPPQQGPGAPPIPYNRTYIDTRYACGCNRGRCASRSDAPGAPCVRQ